MVNFILLNINMARKYIYINGDSYADGDLYLDSPTDCWPYYLIDNNTKIINDALAGGSNYRMFRTSVERLVQNPYEYTAAIFVWSQWSRYETPGGDSYERCYHNTAEEEVLLKNFITQTKTLEKLCENFGIVCWHVNSIASPNLDYIKNSLDKNKISQLIDSLDQRKWILPFKTSIRDWGVENKLEFTKCKHLNAESNRVFGELVKQKIKIS